MSEKQFSWEEELRQLPGVRAGIGVYQNRFHDFDVYTHTIELVKHLRERTENPDLIAAGYLHDIGKPAIATPMPKDDPPLFDAQGHPYFLFRNHEEVGAIIIEKMSRDFFLERGLDQGLIRELVNAHATPMKMLKSLRKIPNWQNFLEMFNGFRNAKGLVDPDNPIYPLFLCDILAHRDRKSHDIRDEAEVLLFYDAITKRAEDFKRQLYELQQTNRQKRE